MDDRVKGYLKMTRLPDTNMFYCKSIHDTELYKRDAETPPDDSVENFSSEIADFWIILTVDYSTAHSISVHFCQRYAHQHTVVLDEMWAGIRQELRILNQESLLEMMYIQRKVDKLLVPEIITAASTMRKSISEEKNPTTTTTEKEKTVEKNKMMMPRGELPGDLYFYFAEGYFACPLQRELW